MCVTFWCPCLGWQRKAARWRWCLPVYTPLQTLCFLTESRNQGGPPTQKHHIYQRQSQNLLVHCQRWKSSTWRTLNSWALRSTFPSEVAPFKKKKLKRKMKTVYNTQAQDYSHVIQTFWPLLKLSPYRDNSAGRVEGRCGRLHPPTQKPNQKKKQKTHTIFNKHNAFDEAGALCKTVLSCISPWPHA